MDKTHEYQLILGEFSASDASQILLEIINNKINYHNRQIFSIKERFNGDVSHSEKRIKALLKTSNGIKKILATAEKRGNYIQIDCPIKIKELIKKK
ncbi:MAG: hypothetical protein U5K54_18430 [Cytophagales bacterium]|nr:hypothetical protein [Cytophagales bacterium]